jgi:hypothetical protein
MKPRRENPLVRFLGASGSFLELTRHLPFASFEVGFYYEDFVETSQLYQKKKAAHKRGAGIEALRR